METLLMDEERRDKIFAIEKEILDKEIEANKGKKKM